MDIRELQRRAEERLTPASAGFIRGTAGVGDLDRDQQAWAEIDLIPRVMRGLTAVSLSTTLAGIPLAAPMMVAATASHQLADPGGEPATARAAAAAGVLMTYSSSAAVEVTEFGATTTAPWWAQVYLMTDEGRTRDYLDRLVAAGAAGVVLTVDHVGTLGDAPFRRTVQAEIAATAANYPGMSWQQMGGMIRPQLTPDDIGRLAERTALPVYVKGILHPADAIEAVAAGAAGVMVSNHGRRQLGSVIPTARALRGVVRAVDGRVPVMVDGGIRSGLDVFRAVALGAAAVGVGRPVLWALAADGEAGVLALLTELCAELRQAMASSGAADISLLTTDLLDLPGRVR